MRIVAFPTLLLVLAPGVRGQDDDGLSLASRIGLVAGMGVSYVNASDIVDLLNGRNPGNKVPDFKAAVEFYGSALVPVNADWVAKLEYSYLLGTYNVTDLLGATEASFSAHLPSLVGQYVLIDHGLYNVKAGAGMGYHVGSYIERASGAENTYRATGVGALLELEANTAFGENLHGNLGVIMRWEFMGELTSSTGASPAAVRGIPPPTLTMFSAGARLGFSYYF